MRPEALDFLLQSRKTKRYQPGVISRFAQQGWISTGYRRITILDQTAIRAYTYETVFQ